MLYSRTLFSYSIYNSLHLLIPNLQFNSSLPPSWQPQIYCLCPWVSFCFADKLTVTWFCMEVVSYGICISFWLPSLSTIISRSIHVAANGIISFFLYGWVVFHCPHLYPFLCWWTFRLSPCFGIVNSRKLNVFIKDVHFFCIYILWSHI